MARVKLSSQRNNAYILAKKVSTLKPIQPPSKITAKKPIQLKSIAKLTLKLEISYEIGLMCIGFSDLVNYFMDRIFHFG